MQLIIKTYMSPIIKNLPSAVKVDRAFKLFAHTTFAKYCAPYVPMRTGRLFQSARVQTDGITYPGPYAHYMYEGMVYGPNIPVRDSSGRVIRWFSPPGRPKHPTGRMISYRADLHPLAQAHWDQAALTTHGQDLADDIADFAIARMLNRGGGTP